jgi:cytoskeletal protein RodZ
MKKVLCAVLLLSYGSSVFAASYIDQYQQDTQKALDLKNKQLKETYDKNREETLQESKKRAASTATPQQPQQSAQPAWEQAVAPTSPAPVPTAAPAAPVAVPPAPVVVAPPSGYANSSTNDSAKPATPAANIYQSSPGQDTTTTSNPYR